MRRKVIDYLRDAENLLLAADGMMAIPITQDHLTKVRCRSS